VPSDERVSPGMHTFIPPPLHYGFHRPARVASSAAPVPAALSASAGQWPASLAIRLPPPTARSPSAAAPWCAGTTTTPAPPFPKLPSSSPPVALLPVPGPPTRAPATARLPPRHAPAWPPHYPILNHSPVGMISWRKGNRSAAAVRSFRIPGWTLSGPLHWAPTKIISEESLVRNASRFFRLKAPTWLASEYSSRNSSSNGDLRSAGKRS
jgi:hypothetical protein